MSSSAEDYRQGVMHGVQQIARILDISVFTGWVRGYYEHFSRCCSAPIYIRSLMEGNPYCSHCHKALGLNDLRYEWVPPQKIGETDFANPWPTEPEER